MFLTNTISFPVAHSCDHSRGVVHDKFYNLVKFLAAASFSASRNGQNTFATLIDLNRPPPKAFKTNQNYGMTPSNHYVREERDEAVLMV